MQFDHGRETPWLRQLLYSGSRHDNYSSRCKLSEGTGGNKDDVALYDASLIA